MTTTIPFHFFTTQMEKKNIPHFPEVYASEYMSETIKINLIVFPL